MLSPSQQLIRLGFGFMISQALNVAADLNVADRLAAGERSVDDLAAETGCRADALYKSSGFSPPKASFVRQWTVVSN